MPPKAWNAKRERQYEHIKDSLEDRGTSEDKAEEIAARTVNKERARAGEAKTSSRLSRTDMSSSRRGGLRSGTRRAKGRTRDQLYEEAKRMGIEGRSKMTKEQLQRAVDRRK
jgi:plasmid stabilization system protein ParE